MSTEVSYRAVGDNSELRSDFALYWQSPGTTTPTQHTLSLLTLPKTSLTTMANFSSYRSCSGCRSFSKRAGNLLRNPPRLSHPVSAADQENTLRLSSAVRRVFSAETAGTTTPTHYIPNYPHNPNQNSYNPECTLLNSHKKKTAFEAVELAVNGRKTWVM
jgi:hypothetical protein